MKVSHNYASDTLAEFDHKRNYRDAQLLESLLCRDDLLGEKHCHSYFKKIDFLCTHFNL
jgi:hypothetical protein